MAPRKKRCRHIHEPPGFSGYVAREARASVEPVILLYEEYEALRLADYDALKHDEAAERMSVSRPTFARIYENVRKKIAKAFVESRPIKFEAGCAYFSCNTNKTVISNGFNNKKIKNMEKVIAIPCENGTLSTHFGHAAEFAFIQCEGEDVKSVSMKQAPPHQPGLLPRWVAEQGGNTVIAGGMGNKAIELFRQNNIDVVTGAPAIGVEELAQQYVSGKLTGGDNRCDH